MELLKWLPGLLIGAGSLIMGYNILEALRLARHMAALRHGKGWSYPDILPVCYIGLLAFFLAGYIAVGVMIYASAFVVSALLVGLIFFFGSVFVLLGIFLQFSLGESLKRANLEGMQALIAAVEARDKNLNGHSIHVARLSMLLYGKLPRVRQRKLNRSSLEYAALFHDVGKLGVPEAILNKDSALTEDEWAEIKKHPQIGRDILQPVQYYQDIAEWVLYHHERWDGKGYLGLAGEKIPLASRLIAVADTFSALTMTRSYRKSKSYEEAIKILMDCRGTQLDEELVNLFLLIPKEEVEACAVKPAQPSGVYT